jgi:hypothetical protein
MATSTLRISKAIAPYLPALKSAEDHALRELAKQAQDAFRQGKGLAALSPLDTELLAKHAGEELVRRGVQDILSAIK